jgi:two-component system, cell cycle response regulator CpdR
VPPARVLVVDDEESIRGFVAEALKMDDLDVESARDGLDAMQRLEEQWYDLVVSDLRMPRLDGVGLYREVERRWPGSGRRLLFISGSTVLPDYEPFLREVHPVVIEKPFGLDELRRTVRRMLREATPGTSPR